MANKSTREELVEILQYHRSRARLRTPRPWYYRLLVWLTRRLE